MKLKEKVGNDAGMVFWNPAIGQCYAELWVGGINLRSLVGYKTLKLDLEGKDESGELQLFPAKDMSWDEYDSSLLRYPDSNYDLLSERTKTAVSQLYHMMCVRENWITTKSYDFENAYSIVDMRGNMRVICDSEHKHLFEFPTRCMALQFLSTYYLMLKDIKRYLI